MTLLMGGLPALQAQAQAQVQESGATETEEGLLLNFQGASLESIVTLVSQETGINFLLDPRVRGEVTLISHTPVAGDELYQAFLAMLRIHGFTTVPSGEAVRILPQALAPRQPLPIGDAALAQPPEQMVTEVLAVEHVSAAELFDVLRPLVAQEGVLSVYSPSNTLILSDTAANVARLKQLIARIDRDTRGDTEVIRLSQARAQEVAALIRDIMPNERSAHPLRVAADTRANAIVLSGPANRRLSARALAVELDTDTASQARAQVIKLRFADAATLAPILERLGSSLLEGRLESESRTRLQISAAASTNSLVLNGPADVMRELREVIDQLDVRRAQVLVEAIIAEVSQDRLEQMGVQWEALQQGQALGAINFAGGLGGDGGVLSILQQGAAGTPPAIDGITIGGGDLSGSNQVGALVQALSTDASANILSTPSLMTMDNEQAEIIVGQNVPFITGRAIEDSGQAFSSIQRQDVGVQLRIRPQINEGDVLRLDIEQEVSSISGGIQGAADLVTDLRSITTSVMVDSGQLVVLGGLIDDQMRTQAQKVPLLGDIPGLGRLFRFDRSEMEKRNLIIFLRPMIVRSADDQAVMTAARHRDMQRWQQRFQEAGVPLLSDAKAPMLEDLEAFMTLPPIYEQQRAWPGGTALPPPE